jgi:hypothetical protein
MKKNRFKKTRHDAHALMADDHFRLAGRMYRIKEVSHHGLTSVLITFYALSDAPVAVIQSMHVARNTPFTIYNQK